MRITIFTLALLGIGCAYVSKEGPKLVDLTHSFDEKTIYWPTEKGFEHVREFYGPQPAGYFYAAYRMKAAEHGGTHIDAPIHFNGSG